MSERRANHYCAEERIPAAARFGHSWAIPENAEEITEHLPREPPYASSLRAAKRLPSYFLKNFAFWGESFFDFLYLYK